MRCLYLLRGLREDAADFEEAPGGEASRRSEHGGGVGEGEAAGEKHNERKNFGSSGTPDFSYQSSMY